MYSGNFGVLKMYLHRYLRLTPVYGCLILLVISLFRHIGSGPFNTVDLFSNPVSCTKYWWSALLHIQNYVNPQQIVRSVSFKVNSTINNLILVSSALLVSISRFSIGIIITGNSLSCMEVWMEISVDIASIYHFNRILHSDDCS